MTSHTDSDTTYPLRPVQFSRLTKRGIMLGLSLPQLVVLAVAVFALVAGLYLAGGKGLMFTSPVWGSCALVAAVPAGGRKLIEWVPIVARWASRTYFGQLLFRRRVIKPRPAGTLALPGDAAPLREWEDPETGAAMIHDPHAQTLTAIIGVSHPAFVLLDPGEQQRRVSGWGRVLASACRSGRIARIQVSERTLPDSGTGLAEWWRTHGTDDGSWAATVYQDLINRAGPAGERHATTISLALDMNAASRQIRTSGDGMRGAAAVLRQEMTTLTTALRAAELTSTGWLTPGEVAVILRSAYDPAAAPALGVLPRDVVNAG
ncbi:SCO6880 family protein [Propionibacterium freudenreichii]|uniref:SCO6880 family protein n=1 Tax=Propionibacterium freudenreichii TaxID=1744 RepID=UPI0032B73B77